MKGEKRLLIKTTASKCLLIWRKTLNDLFKKIIPINCFYSIVGFLLIFFLVFTSLPLTNFNSVKAFPFSTDSLCMREKQIKKSLVLNISDFPINIDGTLNDWVSAGIKPIIRDIKGDSLTHNLSQDIKEVYSISDNHYLYVGISLYAPPRKLENIEYCFWIDLDGVGGDDYFVGLHNGVLWYYNKGDNGSFSRIKYIHKPIFSIKNAVEVAVPLDIFPIQSKHPYMHIWIHNYDFGNKPIDITYGNYVPVLNEENLPKLRYYVDCSRLVSKECIVKINISNLNQNNVIFSSEWCDSFLGHKMKWPFENIEAKDGEKKISIDKIYSNGTTYIKVFRKDKLPIRNLTFVYKKNLNQKYVENLHFYFGYVTNHEYVDSTGYLFLEPLNVYLRKEVLISFENVPKGWRVFTIWNQVSDNSNIVFVPNFQEIFLRNAFAVGDCALETGKEGNMKLEAVFPKEINEMLRRKYLNYMLKTMDYMKKIWKCESYTSTTYLSVITPKIPDGSIVGAEANRSDMVPFMPLEDFIQEFSHHLFHTRNGFLPCGFHTIDSTKWFLEGTNVFYNKSKVQFAMKIDVTHKKIKELYKEYLNEIYGTSNDFPLSYNPSISGPKIFYDKGALVSFLLDYKIKEVTSGKKSLDDLLPVVYENYSPCVIMNSSNCYKSDPNIPVITNEVLINLLNNLTGHDFNIFFQKYVYGKGRICLEKYFVDTDKDGLSDIDEKYLGTNPENPDTDGGGVNDGDEIIKAQDPLDKSDDYSYDKFSPKITLIYPKDNTWVNEKEVTIIGTVKDNESGLKEVKINNIKINVEKNGNFKYEASLSKVENKIKIVAIDKAGNETEKILKLSLDEAPPQMENICIPQNVKKPYFTIEGTVRDNLSGVEYLKVDGKKVNIYFDGSFSYTVDLNKGKNTIVFELKDKAGNKTIKTFTLNYIENVVIRLQVGSKIMYINNSSEVMDVAPIIIEGRTLLPVRWVSEPLGAKVSWDEKEKKVTVLLNNTTIELWIGKSIARVNGNDKLIDPNNPKVVPLILNNRTMLPLRFVAENIGCKVEWDPLTKTIIITYPKD